MHAYGGTSTRPVRRFGFSALAGAFVLALLSSVPQAAASPADAARSAVQSHIQSIRDDIWYRTRRNSSPGVSYCVRRFRSYDPYSMTYRGYDGRRRHCS